MNLNLLLKKNKIDKLGYYTQITELPMSDLVDFDYKKILPEPPQNTSKKTEKELQTISQATKTFRSKKDLEFIHNIDLDIDSFYIKLLEQNNLTYPHRYINLFYDIVYPILMNTKNYWNRPRPIQLARFYGINIDVILTDSIHTASYPSGHTVYSKLVGNILTELYPKLADKFTNLAKNTGIARIQQGVHYPSDNAASFIFGDYVYKKLQPKLNKYRD